MTTSSILPGVRIPDLAVAAIGLAVMYLPIYWWAANTIWQTDDQAHGSIILTIVVWLLWQQRRAIFAAPRAPANATGWSGFALGMMIFIVGRVLGISILELASQIPVVLGVVLILRGWPAARAAWFPILYLIFMVPLPGILVDAVTGPLKQWISYIAENSLYAAGYPIARNGVMLSIGQYQLLVADACSGLHSMFSLSALGLLYMYIVARKSVAHNILMFASLLPIAFAANIVRVIVLVLVTYHFGDEAGQGFLHGAAGIVLLMVALLFVFALDAILAPMTKSRA